jgi:hypothetical protein
MAWGRDTSLLSLTLIVDFFTRSKLAPRWICVDYWRLALGTALASLALAKQSAAN